MKISLYEKQRFAFYSPATEVLFGGAAGPGKSLLMRISAIRWCEEIPGVQVYLFRRTFPDLESNHLNGPTSFFVLLAPLIEKGLVVYRSQKNEFVWVKTNSRIALCHCQYEKDVYKYQGAEIHVLMIDELTLFTEEQYRFLRGRVRCVGLNIPQKFKGYLPRIECASNPGNIGHAWVKKTFEIGSECKTHKPMTIWKTDEKEGGLKRQFIPALAKDNPSLLKDDPGYFERLKGLGSEALVRAMSDGDWDIFAGQYFEKFRNDIHVVSAQYKIENHWTKFAGFDWGFNHPYVFGLYAVDDDGVVFKFRECGGKGRTIEQASNEIKQVVGNHANLEDLQIAAGHDCFAERDGGPTIAARFADEGIYLIPASIQRVQGANTLRELLDWSEAKKPKFYITDNCWRTRKQIPAMLVNPNRTEDVLKVDSTDKDEWCGDDAYDETRYALHTYFELPKEDAGKKYEHLTGVSKDFWMAEKGDHPTQQNQDVYAEFRKMFGQ